MGILIALAVFVGGGVFAAWLLARPQAPPTPGEVIATMGGEEPRR